MQRTAICACGQASITVIADPEMHGVCHCTNCKRRTGSGFGISSYFPKSSVVEMTGATTIYAFHNASQKHDQERHFCSKCGTTLYWYLSTAPQVVGIAAGCFADGELPEPTYSVTHQKKERWLTLPQGWKVYSE